MTTYTAIDAHRDGRHVWTSWFAGCCYLCRGEVPGDVAAAAAELDSPRALVSHVEVLTEHATGASPAAIAGTLGVSVSTVRRLLRGLTRAGLA